MTDDAPRWDVDDVGVVAAGAAYGLLTALPWYEVSGAGGVDQRYVWELGLWIAAPALVLYAAARVLLLRRRPPKPDVPVTPAAETFVATVVALLVTVYRAVAVPAVAGPGATRTAFLSAATAAVVFQAVFAARKLGKVGLRA